MRAKNHWAFVGLVASSFSAGCSGVDDSARVGLALDAVPTVAARAETPPLHGYDEAPRTPDSDDPAVWIHPQSPQNSLVFGALKDAGLQVYDLRGRVVQTIVPPNRPGVAIDDPETPGPQPDPGTGACPESESGETFGRFNNLDVAYDFDWIDNTGRKRRTDILVVTDRGCDRLRTYAIDPARIGGPLLELTSAAAPRAFPERYVNPSPYQPTGSSLGVEANPLDDQSTAYGLTLHKTARGQLHAFVTQRSRSIVAEFQLKAGPDGSVSYMKVREFRFPALFTLARAGEESVLWSPCRENSSEDPQLEGLVVDHEKGVLYAAQEVVGLWRIPLRSGAAAIVDVPAERLLHRTQSFGSAFFAIPEDDEFACQPAEGSLPIGALYGPGAAGFGGEHLAADVEGLALYYARNGAGYLLVSSQGDDTYHVYDRRVPARHLSSFLVAGTGETDGHEVVSGALGRSFPRGLFVTQNGKAQAPTSTEPVNGYEVDNSTQFKLVDWGSIANASSLIVDTRAYDPRSAY